MPGLAFTEASCRVIVQYRDKLCMQERKIFVDDLFLGKKEA